MNNNNIAENTVDFDEEFAELLSAANDILPEAISSSPFPATIRGTLGLMCSADSIKLGMIELAQAENLYGASILYRSLIEHFVRFQYLFFRWMEDRNDEAGKEYEAFSLISEGVELANAFKLMTRLEGSFLDFDTMEIMKQKGMISRSYSQRELNAITNKWKYRSVISYVICLQQRTESQGPLFLARLIPAYAELSSFVHGGKAAEGMTATLQNDNEDVSLAWEHAKWGCILASSIKVCFFLILGQKDSRFLRYFSASSGRLRRFLDKGT